MKRIFLAALGLLAAAGLCNAASFEVEGLARQDLRLDGMYVVQPSLPHGSIVTVTNLATGRSVEASVLRVPAESPGGAPLPAGWVADLSPAVASVLEIFGGDLIRITVATSLIYVPPLQGAENPGPVAGFNPPEGNFDAGNRKDYDFWEILRLARESAGLTATEAAGLRAGMESAVGAADLALLAAFLRAQSDNLSAQSRGLDLSSTGLGLIEESISGRD
ncbi:MAG: septal ring lytic transglycosylase RlpA family protein [Treponema sp.]|nr:septal ring lytic transglycosylase RlpA family protein [Treponema sp.]